MSFLDEMSRQSQLLDEMRIDRILVATKPDLLLVVVVALLVGVASRSGGRWDLEKKSIRKIPCQMKELSAKCTFLEFGTFSGI